MDNSGNNSQLSSLFNNLTFEFNNQKIKVNNETDLLNYIQKIDTSATNFDKKYKYKYLNGENLDEKNEKNLFYYSLIKGTFMKV